MDLGVSTIGTLDKGASLWNRTTRVGRPTDVFHWSVPDHICGKPISVVDAVSAKSDYNCKTDFEILRENQAFERKNSARS